MILRIIYRQMKVKILSGGRKTMEKVECINERDVSSLNNLKKGKIYYLDLLSIEGDFKGDWYGNIYEDDKKNKYVGRFRLSHFKTY